MIRFTRISQRPQPAKSLLFVVLACLLVTLLPAERAAAQLRAGAAKVDITHPDSKEVESPLYSRALVISSGAETMVLVTMDVVSIGEIGLEANYLFPISG